MTTTSTNPPADGYLHGQSAAEHERLRVQARAWEAATGRLFDRVQLAPGARCLDAGCGPGVTMRLMAQRVGPAGAVLGVDIDERTGADAVEALHSAGHHQCAFARVDLGTADAIPGAPFDLVFARLLLIHLRDPVRALRTLWNAVADGGHVVIQDYDLRSLCILPVLDTETEFRRVVFGTYLAAGRQLDFGHRLPLLFAQAGVGTPDGTDVAGRLEPLRTAGPELAAVWASVLPAAVRHGLTTSEQAQTWREAFARDTAEHPEHTVSLGAADRRLEAQVLPG